jgi:hypothetical protein
MSKGIALLSLAALVTCPPAAASQPEGLAGKIITNAKVAGDLICDSEFQWYEFFGPNPLDPADTLMLDLAIIPFATGATAVGLDEGTSASSFVSLAFADGLVNGLPYRPQRWNDVSVEVRMATQDYLLTVNGSRAGPFLLGGSCAAGCFSVQAFRLNGSSVAGGGEAWVDSISLTRHSADGFQPILQYTAGPCSLVPTVSGGGLIIADPAERHGRGRCAGGAR